MPLSYLNSGDYYKNLQGHAAVSSKLSGVWPFRWLDSQLADFMITVTLNHPS